jgi:DNA-binding GntR family transcriptional regulator
MPGQVKRQVLFKEVAELLREKILTQALRPREWIDEPKLAEEMGISRTPLREALKVLEAEGLVELRPRRGAFVADLTEEDLNEIFPVMALLEGRCAYEAARKAKPEDVERLEAIHAKLEEAAAAGDIATYYEHNYAFHLDVQELSGNRWLQRMTNELRRFLKLLRGRQLNLPGRMEASLNEHRLLMAAFRNRNPAAAEKIMHDHVIAQRSALEEYDRSFAGPGLGRAAAAVQA